MATQTDDATLHAQSSSAGSSATSPIDLTSPSRQPDSSEQRDSQADTDSTRPTKTYTRDEEAELRLIGDYEVPADAVEVPHPELVYWHGLEAALAMPKPKLKHPYLPVDNIDFQRRNPEPTLRRVYGRKHIPAPALYTSLEQHPNNPARTKPLRNDNFSFVGGSSDLYVKRRNSEDLSESQVIDLSEVDNTEPVVTKSQPRSEFQNIETFRKNTLARVKTPSKPQATSSPQLTPSGRTASSSITPNAQRNSNQVAQGESKLPSCQARKVLLQELAQGVTDCATDDSGVVEKQKVTSSHFPNARINESTSGVQTQNGDVEHEVTRDGEMNDSTETDWVKQDTGILRRKTQPSIAKATHTANRGTKRKADKYEDVSKGWQLVRARAHGFDATGSYTAAGEWCLLLEHRPTGWYVLQYDIENASLADSRMIQDKDINFVQSDEYQRMRIEGPRCQDGNKSTWDLKFKNSIDLLAFRNDHVVQLTASQRFQARDETYMERLFSIPIPKNVKVGTTPLATPADGLHSGNSYHLEQSGRPSASLMSKQMKPFSEDMNGKLAPSNTNASSALVRVGRSTRSSAPKHDVPTHDLNEANGSSEVEKYSVVHGLGKSWHTTLTYGVGRQKTSVSFMDLCRLDEGEYLNDNLIGFYMNYLFDKSNVSKEKVLCFNTHFFSQLTRNNTKGIDYEAVKRWTLKGGIDVFTYDHVVIPINQDTHWYLAIMCNIKNIARRFVEVDSDDEEDGIGEKSNNRIKQIESADEGNLFDEASALDLVDRDAPATNGEPRAHITIDDEATPRTVLSNLNASPQQKRVKRKPAGPKRDPNQPVIIVLDSLGQPRSSTVKALKEWVEAEGMNKRGMEATIKEKGCYPKAEQIPLQSNWTDCGVYLLGYLEKFFQNPDEFKDKILTGEMDAHVDWPELQPKEMRNNLRNILFDLAEEQKLTEEPEKKKRGKKASATKKTLETAQLDGTTTETVGLVKIKLDYKEREESLPPQLGSPFSMKARVAKPEVEPKSPGFVGKVSDSPPIYPSQNKAATTSPYLKRAVGRQTSPEVRIPASARSSPELLRATTSVSKNGLPMSPTSPLKRSRQALGDDDELRLPSSKKRMTKSPVLEEKKTPCTTPSKRRRQVLDDDEEQLPSPKKRMIKSSEGEKKTSTPVQQRRGSSDNPIEIDDSQEVNTPIVKSPRKVHVRRQTARSPRNPPKLRQSPSVEEIQPPRRANQQKPRKTEESDISRQLLASLDADDAERKTSLGASSQQTEIPNDSTVQESPDGSRQSPVEIL